VILRAEDAIVRGQHQRLVGVGQNDQRMRMVLRDAEAVDRLRCRAGIRRWPRVATTTGGKQKDKECQQGHV